MAKTNTGKRFDSDKDVTKKGTTNANRRMPAMEEKVVKSAKEDINRLKKKAEATTKDKQIKATQSGAAGRAASRLAGRAGYMGYALTLGKELGEQAIAPRMLKNYEKELEKTGVKLSKDAQRRVNEMKAKEKEDKDFKDMERGLREQDERRADEKYFKEEKLNRELKAKGLRYDAEFLGEKPKKQYAKGGAVKKGKK